MTRFCLWFATLLFLIPFASCSSGPQPIKPGQDGCASCKMTISDVKFGAEIITQKGKAFKFDDVHCMLAFIREEKMSFGDIREVYFTNFDDPHQLIPSAKALLIHSEELRSPMGGNIAAFDNPETMDAVSRKVNGETKQWEDLKNQQ